MSTFSQIFPPCPTFTEDSLTDLLGKVYIVTGAISGVGFELAGILYGRNATVYICGRSAQSTTTAIDKIRKVSPDSQGRLEALIFDLSKLSTIPPAVQTFLAAESRLDVLFHNAAVMTPPAGSQTADGFDLELGTNCLAPFLLTRLLQSRIEASAKDAPKGAVRIVWVSSLVAQATPKGGVQLDRDGVPAQMKGMDNYMQSKAGGLLLSHEFSQRLSSSGVISVSVNPGLMKTNLQRHNPAIQGMIMGLVFKSPRFGAYSELYAGCAPNVPTGSFCIPWGRLGSIPEHLAKSTKPSLEGSPVSAKFYNWCERQTIQYQV